MNFDFTDALLLHAIHANEKPEFGAVLIHIIGYADYIDHSVLTYEELTDSLIKLLETGLVIQLDKKLATTDLYRTWWGTKFEGKKRIDVRKALQDIKIFLNSTFEKTELSEIKAEINIKPQDFSIMLDKYKESFSKYI